MVADRGRQRQTEIEVDRGRQKALLEKAGSSSDHETREMQRALRYRQCWDTHSFGMQMNE